MSRKSTMHKIVAIALLSLIEIMALNLSSVHNGIWLQTLFISFDSLLIIFLLLKTSDKKSKKLNTIIAISYLIRVAIIYANIYFGVNFFSGADTEAFYESAIGMRVFNHNYVTLLKTLFFIVGDSRIIAEYINVLFSLLTMLILKKTLFNITNKESVHKSLILYSLGVANILLSACLLRESILIFLTMLSIYYFIKWFKKGSLYSFLLSCLFVVLSAWLHSGMLLALIGYSISYVLYSPKTGNISFRKNTIFSLILVLLVSLGFIAAFGSSITAYFERYQKIEDVSAKVSFGNSDYLTFLNNTKSTPVIIATTPLKIIYFFFSPMPWDCRSIGMIASFVFSSLLYLYLFIKIFSKNHVVSSLRTLFLLNIFLLGTVYALGTSSAGTAIRHRENVLPYIIIAYCVSIKDRNNNGTK